VLGTYSNQSYRVIFFIDRTGGTLQPLQTFIESKTEVQVNTKQHRAIQSNIKMQLEIILCNITRTGDVLRLTHAHSYGEFYNISI